MYDSDRGNWRDQKGWIITRLPVPDDDFRYPRDDSLAALEDSLEFADDESSIVGLMRRDVNLRLGGSKGRRRQRPRDSRSQSRASHVDTNLGVVSRIGRPTIGAEVRVYVQTSIGQRTRELLDLHNASLAQILDEFACLLAARGR
jgi:hypothetical protein